MPRITYVEKDFRAATLVAIDQANSIIMEYQAQGFDLTLRQIYYQFVSRALIPNTQQSYKRLGSIINDGRLAGLIDWEAIVDRTRELEELNWWTDPTSILRASARDFRRDRWATQPTRIEVWIEKEALAGVFEPICEELEVPFFCCRGNTSQSEMWVGAQRFIEYREAGQECVILHFGDHDPSGMDMTRDIRDRMEMFQTDLTVRRLALNMDQVEEFGPPPNPTKMSDSKAEKYVDQYGHSSWELDALEPSTLSHLVEDEVLSYRDDELWDVAMEKDEDDVATLSWSAKNWAKVNKLMKKEQK